MKTRTQTIKYVKWLSADEMHHNTMDWLSELAFTHDELQFFEELINSFTFQLVDTQWFSKSKLLVGQISQTEKSNKDLVKIITKHRNELKIMVDQVDQLSEEENYKKEHMRLIVLVRDFLAEVKSLKSALFGLIQEVLKKDKQKRLLDKL
ncbi:hypothetical protein MWU59_09530 [Flavobacteriaceae bacterium F08102]|nr:hypothetical protein [Flavobacteriaceae bacterium F08102]